MTADNPLIIGGGIAGLALAGHLHQHPTHPTPTILEKATAYQRTGWGIGLWGNGITILNELDVADTAREHGTTPDTFEVRSNEDNLGSIALPGDNDTFLAIHRADLHEALQTTVPTDAIKMNTTPEQITSNDNTVTVTHSDGTTTEHDLVIGADGVHSTVRQQCFTNWQLNDAGTAVWSFWADTTPNLPEAATIWAPGTEAFLIHVDGQPLVNIATKLPKENTPDAPAHSLLQQTATDLGWHFPTLADNIDENTTIFFDRNRTVHAENWHHDRIALIGDAAHAVHPISGMGAALALEDAYVLADELTTHDSIPTALTNYEQRRRPRVKRIQRTARLEKHLTFTDSTTLTTIRNLLAKHTPLLTYFLNRQAREYANTTPDDL